MQCHSANPMLRQHGIVAAVTFTGRHRSITATVPSRHKFTKPACQHDSVMSHACLLFVQVFMTFLLVMTVYAAAVVKPGHGNTAPLAIGLSLYAAALTGGGMLV